MRIGFDLDGVLCEIFPAYADMFVRTTGRNTFLPGDIPEPPDYNVHRLRGYTMEEEKQVWKTVGLSSDWWFNLPALPETAQLKDALHSVLDDHECYFITARSGIRVKEQTEDWLRYHLNIDHFPTVLIVGHGQKGNVAQALNLHTYIEDNADNALDVVRKSPETKTYLVNRNYNQPEGWNPMPEIVSENASLVAYHNHCVEIVNRHRVSSVGEWLRLCNLIPYTVGV